MLISKKKNQSLMKALLQSNSSTPVTALKPALVSSLDMKHLFFLSVLLCIKANAFEYWTKDGR